MVRSPQNPEAIWKEFLNLGEDLLSQPDTRSITQHLIDKVSSQFSCSSQIFLAAPAYPLPGESQQNILPESSAPEIVLTAFTTKTIQIDHTTNSSQLPISLAIPLMAKETLLAVLLVTRSDEKAFTRQDCELIEGISSYAAVALQLSRQVTLKNWRYEQLTLVRSVSAQIANVTDLDELCNRVTKLIQSSFDYYSVAVYTIEKDTEFLKFRACATTENNHCALDNIPVKLGQGMVGYSAQSGNERVAKDVLQDKYFRKIETLPKTRAEATIPLIVEGQILGVLDIQSENIESFHENDMLVMRSLADNIALAVDGTNLYNNLQKQTDQLKAVLEIIFALSSVLDLDALLEEIVQRIHDRFNYPFVHIFTVHAGRRKVIYHTGSGVRYQHLKANSFAFDLDAPKGLIPIVARTGKPILANDVENEPLYVPSKLPPHNTRSELTIPLVFGTEILGVLDLQSDAPNSFDSDDLKLFEGLAAGIAVALRNANLFRTEKWRRQVADSFQDVAGMLSANIELSDLLDKILEELEKTLPCDASAIWLMDEHSTEDSVSNLKLAATHGTSQSKLHKVIDSRPEVREFLARSLSNDSPTIRQPSDPFGPLGFACNMPQNYSSLAVPLRAGENVLGTLTLAHHLDGRYGSEASAISATFANYAAVAIQNARLFSTAQEEAWSSTVLLQVTEASQNITNDEELLTTMNRLIPLLVGIDKCAFFQLDSQKSTFIMKSWYGFHPTDVEKSISEIDSLPFLKLITTRQPVYLTDQQTEVDFPSLQSNENSYTNILIPLSTHGEILGALLISHNPEKDNLSNNRFFDHTLPILQGISQQTAVSLENIHLVETRQEEAYITAVLLQVAQAVVSQNDLNDVLDTVIHLMPILVGIETCAFYIWDKKEKIYIPAQSISTNHTVRTWLKQNQFSINEFNLLDEVRSSQKMAVSRSINSLNSPETWKDLPCIPLTDDPAEVLKNNGNWLLAFPLNIKSEFYGVMLACENEVESSYSPKRLELLNGVAQQISLAIQDDRLKQEMIGRERMEQEIQLARQIQRTFLPDKLPKVKDWVLDLRWNTAREVGGDFYDVFHASDRRLAFAIADVSDKGMPAALYMTVTRTLIHSSAQNLRSPAKVLKQVNQQLMVDTQNGMFITAVFGFLDPESGKVDFAIAGHNLPLIYRSNNLSIEKLPKGGMAMGVLDTAKYEDMTLVLNKGDALLLYTDGVTETFSPENEIYGDQQLMDDFLKACQEQPTDILGAIESRLKDFRKSNELSDDMTMVIMQRH